MTELKNLKSKMQREYADIIRRLASDNATEKDEHRFTSILPLLGLSIDAAQSDIELAKQLMANVEHLTARADERNALRAELTDATQKLNAADIERKRKIEEAEAEYLIVQKEHSEIDQKYHRADSARTRLDEIWRKYPRLFPMD